MTPLMSPLPPPSPSSVSFALLSPGGRPAQPAAVLRDLRHSGALCPGHGAAAQLPKPHPAARHRGVRVWLSVFSMLYACRQVAANEDPKKTQKGRRPVRVQRGSRPGKCSPWVTGEGLRIPRDKSSKERLPSLGRKAGRWVAEDWAPMQNRGVMSHRGPPPKQ